MKVDVKCKFMSFSNRIQGTTDDGREYDYYRLKVFYDKDGDEWSFSVRNIPQNAASIAKAAAHKFGDEVTVQVDFSKSRKNNNWYCNLVEVK